MAKARRGSVKTRATSPQPAAGGGKITLQDLLDNLGAIVQALAGPAGLEVEIAEPVIFDADAPSPPGRGQLVMAVGARADSPEAREITRAAAEAGAAAVVFKRIDAESPVVREAD